MSEETAYKFNLDVRVHGMDLEDACERFRDIVALISELVPGIEGTEVHTIVVDEEETLWFAEEAEDVR